VTTIEVLTYKFCSHRNVNTCGIYFDINTMIVHMFHFVPK